MRISRLRGGTCWLLIALTPAYLVAADQSAMLQGKGPVLLNGAAVPANSSAISPGDSIQTQIDSTADITASGASVIILPDSQVTFEGNTLALDHGAVSVASSVGMATHTSGVIVTPHSPGWTEFDITNVKGVVEIAARKGEMTVQCGNDTLTLPEGQLAMRDASGKCKRRKGAGAVPPGNNPLLNPYVLVGAGAAGWVLVLCLLLCSGSSPGPMSPMNP